MTTNNTLDNRRYAAIRREVDNALDVAYQLNVETDQEDREWPKWVKEILKDVQLEYEFTEAERNRLEALASGSGSGERSEVGTGSGVPETPRGAPGGSGQAGVPEVSSGMRTGSVEALQPSVGVGSGVTGEMISDLEDQLNQTISQYYRTVAPLTNEDFLILTLGALSKVQWSLTDPQGNVG